MSEEDTSGDTEDWFEQALREEAEVGTDVTEPDESEDETDAASTDAATTDASDDIADSEGGVAEDTDDAEGLFGGSLGETSESEPGGSATGGTGFDVEESLGETEDNEFGSEENEFAFDEAGVDDSGDGGADESAFGADPTSGDQANPWASDAEVPADEGSPFDDEGFASAFDAGGGGEGEFEDEDFESAIPRIDIGITGLDEMIHGGIPERHLVVAIGGAGTGKTTFGLQFLQHGLTQGENGVFITLEQSHESILATANEFGWDFEHYESEGMLAVVDLDPVEMANSLDNIQAELPALIENFGADRLVLDSVSLLEMMYEDQAKRRTEVYDFTRSLKKGGVTTFLTSEASETNPYASRFGIIEYLTDAVFVLKFVRGETQETRLAIEIQKIRNANHSREMKPYELTDDGISVYRQANIF